MMLKGASKINCKNKFWYKGALGAWSEWFVRENQKKIAKKNSDIKAQRELDQNDS